jgi:hypothetical protein
MARRLMRVPVPAGYLSAREAASMLGISATRLARYRRERIGPAVEWIGGRPVYADRDLRRWARPIDARRRHRHGVTAPHHGAHGIEVQAQPARDTSPPAAESAISGERTNVMPNRTKPKTPTTLTDDTPLQRLAAQLADRYQREDALCRSTDGDDPKARRKFHVLGQELAALQAKALDLAPANLKDAAILAMAAFGAACDMDDENGDEPGQVAVAVRSLLRFLVDASGIDLRDAAGDDFIIETPDREMFPELDEATPAAA